VLLAELPLESEDKALGLLSGWPSSLLLGEAELDRDAEAVAKLLEEAEAAPVLLPEKNGELLGREEAVAELRPLLLLEAAKLEASAGEAEILVLAKALLVDATQETRLTAPAVPLTVVAPPPTKVTAPMADTMEVLTKDAPPPPPAGRPAVP